MAHRKGDVVLAVDTLFMYEVLGALSRSRAQEHLVEHWRDLTSVRLAVMPLSEKLVTAATAQREILDCSLYDAFSAGLASLLRAPLVSADTRAHGAYPQVRLLGN